MSRIVSLIVLELFMLDIIRSTFDLKSIYPRKLHDHCRCTRSLSNPEHSGDGKLIFVHGAERVAEMLQKPKRVACINS